MTTPVEVRRAQIRASLKKRRERLKAEGTCVDCACKKSDGKHVLCEDCLKERRDRHKLEPPLHPWARKAKQALELLDYHDSFAPGYPLRQWLLDVISIYTKGTK